MRKRLNALALAVLLITTTMLMPTAQGAFLENDGAAYSQEVAVRAASSAAAFTDVVPGADCYYYDAVQWAIRNEITDGVDATRFGANDKCTRGQVVTFLWRVSGCPEPRSTASPFTDVTDKTAFYYKAVLWACEQGITDGAGNGRFEPTQNVTRGEFVTFLWRKVGKPTQNNRNPFIDVRPTDYYYNAVLWAYGRGVTTGVSSSQFDPNGYCLRAQTITFLYRYYAGQFEQQIRQALTTSIWDCSVQSDDHMAFFADGTGMRISGLPVDQAEPITYSIEFDKAYIVLQNGWTIPWRWNFTSQKFQFVVEEYGSSSTITALPLAFTGFCTYKLDTLHSVVGDDSRNFDLWEDLMELVLSYYQGLYSPARYSALMQDQARWETQIETALSQAGYNTATGDGRYALALQRRIYIEERIIELAEMNDVA